MPDGRDDTLARFAAQVDALRDARVKVGVLLPTYNRPDLARFCVLQLAAQSRPPDLVCVHQNGVSDSYRWAIEDLQPGFPIAWLHTPSQLPQHQWYSIPLRYLLEQRCTHFFWMDHDDFYLREHIAKGMEDLKEHDFSVSPRTGLVYTRSSQFKYIPELAFTSHAPGGMSSTMCFNRRFAAQLLADIETDTSHYYTDNVVAHVTMPKFRCKISDRYTAIYHSHLGSLSSKDWNKGVFGEDAEP